MADDDEFEEDDEPDLEEEVDLEDDDLVLEVDVVADVEDDVDLLVVEDPVKAAAAPKGGVVAAPVVEEAAEEEDDEVVDLEEELHPDDVEEPLDVLLQERTKADRLNEDASDLEDDEPPTPTTGAKARGGSSRARPTSSCVAPASSSSH